MMRRINVSVGDFKGKGWYAQRETSLILRHTHSERWSRRTGQDEAGKKDFPDGDFGNGRHAG